MPKQEPERRSYPCELRVEKRGDKSAIIGYAAVFDSLSDDLGGFRERIEPGAFDSTLTDDVRALFNHDPNLVLGRTTSNTLRLSVDDAGLRYEVQVPDTQWARDLMVSVDRGDINQSSFAFRALDDDWNTDGTTTIRSVRKAELIDVSPVTFPAYPQTSAAKRSLEHHQRKAGGNDPNKDLEARQRRYEIENEEWKRSTDPEPK